MEYQSVAIVVGNDVVMGEFTRSTVNIHCCQLGHYHWTFPTNVSPSALESATRGTWIIIDKRAATLCFPCQSDVWLTFFSLPSLNSIIGRGPVVNVSQVVILTDNVLLHLLFRRSAGEINFKVWPKRVRKYRPITTTYTVCSTLRYKCFQNWIQT